MKRMMLITLMVILATAGCQADRPELATPLTQPTSTVQVETRDPVAIVEIDNDIVELSSLSNPSPEQSLELSELLKVRAGFEQQANALPGWAEVKPENMEFAVVSVYDVQGDVAGGFLLAKNLETSEPMVLSVVEKFETDGTAVRKQVNSPLFERFSIDAEARLINGDWYYIDAEGNQHSLYKTNAEGKLGGVPIEGEIIWSDSTFRIETIDDLSLAKLAKIALPPGDLTGLTIDTELGQITDIEGALIYIVNGKGELLEMVPIPQEIIEKLPDDYILDTDMMYLKDGLAYGASLQDAKNSVLYVLKNGEWVLAESEEFSERYPAAWSESYVAHVGGVEIPMFFGLTENVIHPTDDLLKEYLDPKILPIREIHINSQEAIEAVGDSFLRSCHYRYVNLMGNEGVSYEDYLELVAQGEGQIELLVANSDGVPKRYLTMIKPSEGFSLVYTNDKRMVVEDNYTYGVYFGVDDFGRVLMATNANRLYNVYTYEKYGDSKEETFFDSNLSSIFALLAAEKNECMLTGNILSACGYEYLLDLRDTNRGIYALFAKRISGELREPIFSVEP